MLKRWKCFHMIQMTWMGLERGLVVLQHRDQGELLKGTCIYSKFFPQKQYVFSKPEAVEICQYLCRGGFHAMHSDRVCNHASFSSWLYFSLRYIGMQPSKTVVEYLHITLLKIQITETWIARAFLLPRGRKHLYFALTCRIPEEPKFYVE